MRAMRSFRDSIELSVDDIVNESLEFQGCGKLYYRED
jgi:hypothetical protein